MLCPQELNEANAKGLKTASENSIMKLGLNIERKKREVCFISIVLKLHFFQILSASAKSVTLKHPS